MVLVVVVCGYFIVFTTVCAIFHVTLPIVRNTSPIGPGFVIAINAAPILVALDIMNALLATKPNIAPVIAAPLIISSDTTIKDGFRV